MAACFSEIDSSVFMRWRLDEGDSASVPASTEASRRDQLRQDFSRQFGAAATKAAAAATAEAKPKCRAPKAAKEAAAAPRVQPTAADARPRQTRQPAATGQQQQEQRDASLKHVRLLTPGTRATRWMHTTWHHLPPNPDASRGNCRPSHFAIVGQEDCGHYRIHPDWGYDAPMPAGGN